MPDNTINKDELDHFLETLKRLILDLEVCSNNIESIINAISENSLKISDIERFLVHYVYLAYSYSSVSIYKMFNSKEKRSFQKLFNKLKDFKYEGDLRALLYKNKIAENAHELFTSKSDVKEAINKLEVFIKGEQEVLDKVFSRRSTFYAHFDPDKFEAPESLKDIQKIKDIAKKVYDILSGGFYDRAFLFTSHYWSVQSVINSNIALDDIYKKMEEDLDSNV